MSMAATTKPKTTGNANLIILTFNQAVFELRSMMRNRSAMIFTFAFPIMFLVIFGMNSGNRTTTFQGHTVPFIQFFVPGIIAYGVIGACYNNLAMRITILRDQGVLKRLRGTPLPAWVYLAGHIATSVVLSAILTVITLVFASLVYDVNIYWHTLPAILLTLLIGAAAFCTLGLTVASIIPNAEAAAGIINVSILPVIFISDIFYSLDSAPEWVKTIGGVLPIKPFANALQVTFNPATSGVGFSFEHLAVVVAWGLLAGVFAAKKFRWEARGTSLLRR